MMRAVYIVCTIVCHHETPHYIRLAIQRNNPDFDTTHKAYVEASVKPIQQIPDIDRNAVQNNISELKNDNKACEVYGITGEHLNYWLYYYTTLN